MSRLACAHPAAGAAAFLAAVGLLTACGDERRADRGARPITAPASTPAPAAPSAPVAPPAPSPPVAMSTAPPPAAASAAPAPATGSLLIPVAGIDFAMLRDSFDEARGAGRHEALDIMAPRGTPVRAVADGRVVKLFSSVPGGLTVYQFDSSQTVAYYYAHLDSYAQDLREGIELKRGDPVGTVGSTGNAAADAPHLHFAVFVLGPERQWWKGTPINPYPLFAGRR